MKPKFNFIFSITLIFILLSGAKLFAGDPVNPIIAYKHYGEEEGLNTKTVYSILQDKEGYLWFATDAGVFRFDGKDFRHYTVNDGLTDNEILNIYQDRRDRIWFLTLNGSLSYWHKGVVYNSSNAHFLKDACLGFSATRIYEDSYGKLWVGYKMAGVITIDDTIVKKIIFKYKYRDLSTHYIYEDGKQGIWHFYDNIMTNLETHDSIKLPSGIFYANSTDQGENSFIMLKDGVYKFRNGKIGERTELLNMPDQNNITSIITRGNDMWICTYGEGCLHYRNGVYINRYLENSSVTSVMIDREGNKWFSTINEGVFLLTKNAENATHYTAKSGLSTDKVISLAVDKENAIWAGYNNGIIEKIKGNTKISFVLQKINGRNFNRITSFIYKNDTLWAGADLGLYYIHNDKMVRVSHVKDSTNTLPYTIKHLMFYDDNNLYASYSLNYMKVEKIKGVFKIVPLLDSIVRTFSSVRLSDNTILVSSSSGLNVYGPGIFGNYVNDSVISNIRALDMKTDDEGLLLIATNDKGLYVLKDKKTYQHITVDEGLTDNNCRKLFIDNDWLYVSTTNGVSVLHKSENRWKVANSITVENGLLSNYINDLTIKNNKIYIASDNGISIINKNLYSDSIFYSRVNITEIITGDTISVTDSAYTFFSEIPRLLLRFAYPVFNPVNQLPVRYRLSGESGPGNWNQSFNNEVEFSSLQPGNYLFEIKPDINNPGVSLTSIHINIIPKWWQTGWFRAAILIFASLLIIYYFRLRVKSQYESKLLKLKNERMIESERNRIADDMHDDIGADLTQISMWMNILNQQANDNEIVKKVRKLSNEVLAKMDQIIWALNSINNNSDDLISYIRAYASESLESSPITLVFTMEEGEYSLNVNSFQRRNVFLVVKELLHNTIKYSNANEVAIHVSVKNNCINICYSDNGNGFDMSSVNDGLGLIIMKKRMDEINSSITINTSPDQGLTCKLSIPVKGSSPNA